jgi:hypothetical protein
VEDLINFDDAIRETGSLSMFDRSLLLGNGFSIAQGSGRFSYQHLLDNAGLPSNGPIKSIFEALNTFDFELVIKGLGQASKIATAYSNRAVAELFSRDAVSVRDSLITAIRTVHPEVHFEIPDSQCKACSIVLNHFSSLFTTNYDLLLYWVIVKDTTLFSDGFGTGDEVDSFRLFNEHAACNTYYVHGALHLFLTRSKTHVN